VVVRLLKTDTLTTRLRRHGCALAAQALAQRERSAAAREVSRRRTVVALWRATQAGGQRMRNIRK